MKPSNLLIFAVLPYFKTCLYKVVTCPESMNLISNLICTRSLQLPHDQHAGLHDAQLFNGDDIETVTGCKPLQTNRPLTRC